MSLNALKAVLAGLTLLASSSLFAAQITVDIGGVNSYGEIGDPANSIINQFIGENSHLTGISYDINVTAYRPSWLEELGLSITNSKGTAGIFFNPGIGDWFAGTTSYSGSANLVDLGLDFFVGNDGILRLEFFEDFDDFGVNPDGRWNFGTITFEYTPQADPVDVPEPATALLLGGGAMLMGFAGRRRRAGKASAAVTA
ncbi:PEP-CTERM sorting domain-containing protein [Massilia sp. YIM B02769]|uniref:PEP-CTERM sorting domain-containing protein n=1 Tax=Massilia sp. YIM B02769 TaxID=3050129 RepID=UPI0025B6BA81|nr:PEP-CTERM sorting domain-containing protein [Massilia sp. YIM B02769]MDN4058424.1 PEP-CTERM sorting domain-containing protein [Massilia sp. YIM B02769]